MWATSRTVLPQRVDHMHAPGRAGRPHACALTVQSPIELSHARDYFRLFSSSLDGDAGALTGDTYTLEVETIEGLNQSLISYCQLHRDGFDLHIYLQE